MGMNRKNPYFLKYHLPLYVWMGVIFSVSSIPQAALPEVGITGIEIVGHVAEYCILGTLLVRAFQHSRFGNLALLKILTISLVIGIFYGATDELHQYFIPGRFMSLYDFLYDAVGLAIGILIYPACQKRRNYDRNKTL